MSGNHIGCLKIERVSQKYTWCYWPQKNWGFSVYLFALEHQEAAIPTAIGKGTKGETFHGLCRVGLEGGWDLRRCNLSEPEEKLLSATSGWEFCQLYWQMTWKCVERWIEWHLWFVVSVVWTAINSSNKLTFSSFRVKLPPFSLKLLGLMMSWWCRAFF